LFFVGVKDGRAILRAVIGALAILVGAVYNEETEKKIPKADVLEGITKELSKSESDLMRKMKAETEPDQGQRAVGSALRA